MNMIFFRRLPVLLVVTAMFALQGFSTISDKVVNDFRLKNVDGSFVSMKDFPNAKGFIIVFTCNHCPFAKLYPERLNELNAKFSKQGVPLIAISSTDTNIYDGDTYPLMVAKARDEHFNFPYLYDGLQSAARDFRAQKTPHAYVVWKENGKWVVKYNGAIDDNGAEPAEVKRRYVAEAVNELLSGKQVSIKETKSIGCEIKLRK